MLQPPGEVHCSEVGFSGELVGRMVEGEESRERRRVSSGVLFGRPRRINLRLFSPGGPSGE